MNKRILVLGGNGFVGSQVVQEALKKGYEVVVGCRTPQDSRDFDWVEIDALDEVSLQKHIEDNDYYAIVNCIGILFDNSSKLRKLNKLFSGSGNYAKGEMENYENIIEGISMNIFNNAKPSTKMVFMSAAETKWEASKVGRTFEKIFIPSFLKEYLKRKRIVDSAIKEDKRVKIFYPSIVYQWKQVWKIPVVMMFRIGSLFLPIFYNPIHVDKLSTRIIQSIQ